MVVWLFPRLLSHCCQAIWDSLAAGVPNKKSEPDIASFLLGPDHSLPWDNQAGKYMLRLENESSQFAGNPLRLGAVYLLGSDNREIDRLSSRDGLLALSRFPYLPDLLDKSMVRAQFEMLSSLALTIPVCQLPSFRDPTQLVDLGQKIVKHVGKHLMDAA